MKRFYVAVTWHDWPEGGSYGTVVAAENFGAAVSAAKQEMAELQAEDWPEGRDDDMRDPGEWLRLYGHDWHVVGCFDMDDFIRRHAKKEEKPE